MTPGKHDNPLFISLGPFGQDPYRHKKFYSVWYQYQLGSLVSKVTLPWDIVVVV